MAAKVEILSKEIIKPSSPTDPTFRTHKLSLLDQMAPPTFIPLIFFYQHDIMKRSKDVQSLKHSLSQALTRFYPLAGRLNGNTFVDCNDTGVEFIEAQVHDHLLVVLENPKIEELEVLLPVKDCDHDITNQDALLSIQVNLFDCGEIAIGVRFCHKVGDFSSMATFMNAWAAAARGDIKNVVQPNLVLASNIFPPIDASNSILAPGVANKKQLVRRFVFNKEKLDGLKKSVTSGSQVKDPTRTEALSSLIWKHFNENSKLKKVNASQVVNIRSRVNPPLPDHSFGNLAIVSVALLPNGQESESYDLVHHMRNATRAIDSDYIINASKNREESLKIYAKQIKGYSEFCKFTSWCRFPVYEVDFGWGKPIKVCTTTYATKNLTIFMDTKCGGGVEAYVNMVEDDGLSEALLQLTTT